MLAFLGRDMAMPIDLILQQHTSPFEDTVSGVQMLLDWIQVVLRDHPDAQTLSPLCKCIAGKLGSMICSDLGRTTKNCYKRICKNVDNVSHFGFLQQVQLAETWPAVLHGQHVSCTVSAVNRNMNSLLDSLLCHLLKTMVKCLSSGVHPSVAGGS